MIIIAVPGTFSSNQTIGSVNQQCHHIPHEKEHQLFTEPLLTVISRVGNNCQIQVFKYVSFLCSEGSMTKTDSCHTVVAEQRVNMNPYSHVVKEFIEIQT